MFVLKAPEGHKRFLEEDDVIMFKKAELGRDVEDGLN